MKQLHIYAISRGTANPQTIQMPRRARITGMHIPPQGLNIHIYAEVEHDHDTKAFDNNQHTRTFRRLTNDDVVPEDGSLVAFEKGIHLYEVRTP